MDDNNTLKVDNIFVSINGETSHSGSPTIFVRLFGCNVRCNYCDTPQKGTPNAVRIGDIVKKVVTLSNSCGIKDICITGGEPLIQDNTYNLVDVLQEKGFNVYIETNGLIPIRYKPNRKYHYIMDIKVPSSGLGDISTVTHQNLFYLIEGDEVKIVFGNESDVIYAFHVIEQIWEQQDYAKLPFKLFLSPLHGMEEYQMLANTIKWVIETPFKFMDKTNIHFQTQLHKLFNVE